MDIDESVSRANSGDVLGELRAANAMRMERAVRCAISSLVQEGKTLSFYNVAARSQVARSTLYRRQALRSLVEAARARASSQPPQVDPYAHLLEENARLRQEVSRLCEEARRAGASRTMSGSMSGVLAHFDYAVVEFPRAA